MPRTRAPTRLPASDKVRHAVGDAAASSPGSGAPPADGWLDAATLPAAGEPGAPATEGVPVSGRTKGRGPRGRATESKRGAR